MSGRYPHTVISIMAVLISLTALSCSAQALSAATGHGNMSLCVSPTYIVTEVRDGDLIGPVTVSNTGNLPLDLQGFINGGGHDENGIPVLLRPVGNTPADGVSLTLEPAKFRLMPGESVSVKVRAHVSGGFAGGAYPIILFQGKPAGKKHVRDVNTSSQVGVLTLITVGPGQTRKSVYAAARIKSVALSQDPVDKSVTVSAICENQGNIHINLQGTAVIRYYHGEQTSFTHLTPAVCLPGYKRVITGYFNPSQLSKGIYVAEVLVKAEGSPLPVIPVAFQVADNGMINVIRTDPVHPMDIAHP